MSKATVSKYVAELETRFGMRLLNRFTRSVLEDHSRVSLAAIKPDETSANCTQFLREAVAAYARLDVRIDRVMTDNDAGYKKSRRGETL